VEPVDDFRVSNPAVNEPLLNALAADFAQHDFDLKHVMRRILNSELYQLSSTPNETNPADTKNFSRSMRRDCRRGYARRGVRLTVRMRLTAVRPGRAIQTWTFKLRPISSTPLAGPTPLDAP
jgi:hypothetical protein